VAVRSMVPRKKVNSIMDELVAAGAKADIATDIRSCRMG
ncbi:MAG: ATP phosphoribosyltransferase, partial [Dietzia sp.]|nr:ATP phosphoribosyltransferase [Dietzia sp.]